MPEKTTRAIRNHTKRKGAGWVFTPKDFSRFGSTESVHVALHRFHKEGRIRRLARGLYDSPKYSELFQKNLGPDIDQAAKALARKFGYRIYPNGNTILNMMGISTQVPAKHEYLTDGPSQTFSIAGIDLFFKKASLRETSFRHLESVLIVQGLRALGPNGIDDRAIEKMRAWLPVKMRRKVRDDTGNVVTWIYDAIRRICGEEQHAES